MGHRSFWHAAAAVALLAAIAGAPSRANAQSSVGVEPLLLEVQPGASAAMRMRNNGQSPSTVEVRVFERMIDENGLQTRREADDDFIIFPPQAVVPAQSLQVFRVQPINPAEAKSRSYFVSIRQVPVVLPNTGTEGAAQVQLLFAFDSAVHIVPKGATAKPVLVSTSPGKVTLQIATGERRKLEGGGDEPVIAPKEFPAVTMTVRNDGNKFFYLQNMQFKGSWTDTAGVKHDLPAYSVDQIINAAGVTLVPPGSTRRFSLPLPEGAQMASAQIEMTAAQK
jgi:fimbrial chaperone protein